LRELMTRVRADMIATLVQDGGFHAVDSGLTMHIREKAPDGSFRDIFVNDERNPEESLQYSATKGVLIERPAGSFLVLQDGDMISENHTKHETRIVDFATYALDLSQLGSPNGIAVYHAKDRSTLYLLDPPPNDEDFLHNPARITFEIHDRASAPLYTLAFAFLTLAFLGRPRTNRQDRTFAIAAIVFLCVLMRSSGFAAAAVARSLSAQTPFMYAIPLGGILFGLIATFYDARLPIPRTIEAAWDRLAAAWRRLRPARAALAETQP
jgi:lipopolysaccharide export system permease protein